jgi:hypothetical protein
MDYIHILTLGGQPSHRGNQYRDLYSMINEDMSFRSVYLIKL